MERSRRGRVTRARSRNRSKAAWSVLLVGLLAALAVVAGSALNFGTGKTARLSSDDTHAPLLGASINGTDLGQETSEFGHMAIVRTYYPGLPSANAWTTGLPAANKSAVIVSFKAEPKTILSGQDDAALSHFFDTAPTGNPIYWSYFHEPEGNIADGEFTLADYKAAWAHVVQLANAAHNPDLHSTLILGGYDFSSSSHRSWKDYLPGGGIISTLGWDAYPPGSAKNQNPIAAPPDTFMAQEIAAAKSVGLPYGFAEFGLFDRGRPARLADRGWQLSPAQRRRVCHPVERQRAISHPQADRQCVDRCLEELCRQVRLRHLGASTSLASTQHLGASTSLASAEPHGSRAVARD